MKKLGTITLKIYIFLIVCFCLTCFQLCAQSNSMTPGQAQTLREAFVEEIKTHIGAPYEYGAVGPDAFDCSGLIYYSASKSIKVQLPRTAKAIYNYARIIPDENREIGDLMFFKTTGSSTISHIGVYIGNNQFISAISDGPNTGVIISSLNQDYWKPKYKACGQFLPSGKSKKGSASGDSDFYEEDFVDDQTTSSGGSSRAGNSGADNVKFKGSSFYNPKAEGLDALAADASLFCDWSLISPNSFMFQFRGIDLHTNVRYTKWVLEPGFGFGLRFNLGMGVFQMPLMFSATVNDYFRFYAGPVVTFGNPRMMVTGEEAKASVFPGIIGKVKGQVVQDISYTVFNKPDNSALSFTNSISAGLVFFTGIRVTLGIGSLFKGNDEAE